MSRENSPCRAPPLAREPVLFQERQDAPSPERGAGGAVVEISWQFSNPENTPDIYTRCVHIMPFPGHGEPSSCPCSCSLDDGVLRSIPSAPTPMTSQDKDVGPSLSSPWDAIMEAIREQLPTLDSDSSLSDCEEEELFIFQRNQTALIPDLSEELAEDSAGALVTTSGSPPEPAVWPVGPTPDAWREWTTGTQDSASLEGRACVGPLHSLLRMPAETHGLQNPWWPQGKSTLSAQEAGLQTEPLGAASLAQEGSDSDSRRALRRERRKMMEKDILHKVTWDAWDPACCDLTQVKEMPPEQPREGLPVLSLQQLEEWDLDQVLQSLTGREDDQGDGAPGAAWWAANHCQGQDHTEPSTQDRLMEQLGLLCATQSRTSSSARRAPADTPQDSKQEEAGSRSASKGLGIHADLGPRLAEDMRLRSPAEPPTVFMDLRLTKPSAQGSSGSSSSHSSCSSSCISSSSDSEEEGEEETAALRDQRGPARLRDCTRKSQLLQQLRAFRKATAQPELPAGEGPSSQKAQAPGDTAEFRCGGKQHVTLRAERQSAQARPPGGSPGALGEPLGSGTVMEALAPPLGQL
nr:uncharacterized protein C16orf71 homolog isoform X3 [Camelus dromedarius]